MQLTTDNGQRTVFPSSFRVPTSSFLSLPPFRAALAERDFAFMHAPTRLAFCFRVARAQGASHVASRPHQLVDELLPPLFRYVRIGCAPAATVDQHVMPVGGFLNTLNLRAALRAARLLPCPVLRGSGSRFSRVAPLRIRRCRRSASFARCCCLALPTRHLSLVTRHCLSNSLDDVRRRSAFDEGQREDAPARRFHLFAPVNFVQIVVAAFD